MISKTRSLEVSDPPKRHCDELEYEDECDDNEYLYELEQEVQRETHVWAHAPCDDEFDKLHVLACLQEAAENDDIASEPTATTASLEVCAQDKLRRALRSIRTASRAQNGLQGWSRGGLFPPVCIKTIRIKEPRLATFDVTRKQCATDGSTVEFAPLPDGTTVISMGMGGMKTVRLIEFVELMKLPTVFISARRNLANMLESKLESMRVHNYLEVPEGKTVGEWCNHTCVIISTEQVDKLSSCIETYSGGILVIDEVCTVADSIRRGGTTVRWPEHTIIALRKLSQTCRYTILMDADVDYDGKTEAFMRCIAPMRDVRHFQGTHPAMERTLFVGFRGQKHVHSERFKDWKDLCLYRARDARRKGKPNRVFYGGSTPKEVVDQTKAAEKLGVRCLPTGYHGKMSDGVRKEHFRDPNAMMEQYDFIATSTVMAVGTDLDLKFSHAFFETRRGQAMSELPCNQTMAQLTGRPGRSVEKPLDDVVLGGVMYKSAMFMLIGVGAPEVTDEELEEALSDARVDRVDRKFRALAKDERAVLDAMRDADQSARAEFMRSYGLQVQLPNTSGDSRASFAPVTTASEPSLENDIADLLRWNVVSHRDQYETHARSMLELLVLPTRGYTIVEMPDLPDAERAELAAYRTAATTVVAGPALSKDEKWGRIANTVERYETVRDEVVRNELLAQFWADCCGFIEKRERVDSPSARVQAYREVWGVLRHLREFVSNKLYNELYSDKDRHNVLNRALMRFLPLDVLQRDYVDSQDRGKVGGAMSHASLPAALKLQMLQELSDVLKLDSTERLLTPQTFNKESAWVAAHNRLQLEDTAPVADVSMRDRARQCAIKMGCSHIKSGPRGTTLSVVVETVLRQQCAMKTIKQAGKRKVREEDRATRTTVEFLRTEEVAQGCAENMLVYCKQLREYGASADEAYVPASEYRSRIEKAKSSFAEDAHLRELSLDLQFGTVVAAPLVFDISPYNPMVMYEPIDADALRRLLVDLQLDERERRTAADALECEILSLNCLGNSADTANRLLDQLLKQESAHKLLAQLSTELSSADEDGRRTRRVQYAQGRDQRCRPANTPTFRDAKNESRPTTLQGMFSDLRAALTGRFLFDIDGVHSGPTLMLEMAHRAGYDIGRDESLRSVRDCIDHREEWMRIVAAHHGVEPHFVKRWSTALINGAGYKRLLADTGLREDAVCEPSRVVPLIDALEQLRHGLLNSERYRQEAARLQGECETKIQVFSKLIFQLENEALHTIVKAVRKMNRDVVGEDAFDERPARRRDVGALVFDGAMLELEPEVRARGEEAVERDVNRALRESGFVRYCVKIKPNFGRQDDAIQLMEDGRAALKEALAMYPEVRMAVERVHDEEWLSAVHSEVHESDMDIETHEECDIEKYDSEMHNSDNSDDSDDCW